MEDRVDETNGSDRIYGDMRRPQVMCPCKGRITPRLSGDERPPNPTEVWYQGEHKDIVPQDLWDKGQVQLDRGRTRRNWVRAKASSRWSFRCAFLAPPGTCTRLIVNGWIATIEKR